MLLQVSAVAALAQRHPYAFAGLSLGWYFCWLCWYRRRRIRSALARWVRALGFRWGVTRLVWCGRRSVYKVPMPFRGWHNFVHGVSSNLREADTCAAFSCRGLDPDLAEGRRLLCPVTWRSWGAWMLRMPRVERELTWAEVFELDLQPWEVLGLGGDDKPHNYGWLDGRPVKLDYGHFYCVIRINQQPS